MLLIDGVQNWVTLGAVLSPDIRSLIIQPASLASVMCSLSALRALEQRRTL